MPSWPELKNVNDYLKIISDRIFNVLAIASLAFSHDQRKKKTAGDIRKPVQEALLQGGPNGQRSIAIRAVGHAAARDG